MRFVLITGPPCSGKTTYVKTNRASADIVYDFDEIAKALFYAENRVDDLDAIRDYVKSVRDALIDQAKADTTDRTVWLISCHLSDDLKIKLADTEYEHQAMETTLDECLARLEQDETRPDKDAWRTIIESHFDEARKGDHVKQPNLKPGREYRFMAGFNTDPKQKRFDTEYYIEGYAATFQPYHYYDDSNGNPIYEHFLPEAFKSADMSDVILQFDHAGKVYARLSNQTLIIEIDDHGLFIAADLSKTAGSRELYDEISQGMISRMSWAFMSGDVEYDEKTRTIIHKSVKKIFDVSVVSIPANNDTAVYARTLADGVIGQAEAERLSRDQAIRRIQLKLKLYEES